MLFLCAWIVFRVQGESETEADVHSIVSASGTCISEEDDLRGGLTSRRVTVPSPSMWTLSSRCSSWSCSGAWHGFHVTVPSHSLPSVSGWRHKGTIRGLRRPYIYLESWFLSQPTVRGIRGSSFMIKGTGLLSSGGVQSSQVPSVALGGVR